MRIRQPKGKYKTTCSKCKGNLEEVRIGLYRYCLKCHAEYMRSNRPKHRDLPDEQRKKANARATLRVYIKRGKVVKLPCYVCGNNKVEAHHPDYDKPLEVIWFCRKHHLLHHQSEKA